MRQLVATVDMVQKAIDGVASALTDAEGDGRPPPPAAAETLAQLDMLIRAAIQKPEPKFEE